MVRIGDKLKLLRDSKNLNQEDIAKFLNITQGTYCNYENDVRRPSFEIIVNIADFYNCSTDYILGRYKN
jgi:transcriptional regulator with XRE-family HTH domain